MNFLNILSKNTKLYLFPKKIAVAFFALALIMVGISSCDEDLPGVGSIDDNTPPSAVFSYTAGSDASYNEITFSNASISSTDYAWDFGDGSTSTDVDPVHTYAADGTYTVTLTASDKNNATSTATETITIVAPPIPLSADFSFEIADDDFATANFTNASISADTYSWDFGDGTGTSDEENPQYTYAAPGAYEVDLTASNSVTAESETVTRTVNIIDPSAGLTADFTYVAGDPNTYEITFTNLSAAATDYVWDFGDGNTSTDANPVYTYAAPGGTFTVTLTSSDMNGGSEMTSQTIVVSVPAPTFLPVIFEAGFEDNDLPDGSGNGVESWEHPNSSESDGTGKIQISGSPVAVGLQAGKLPADETRLGYQEIIVEPYQNYRLDFVYTMKTTPVGTMTVAVLDQQINDLSEAPAAMISSVVLDDQTSSNDYVPAFLEFNSGPNTEVIIYFKNDDVECRIDDFTISFN